MRNASNYVQEVLSNDELFGEKNTEPSLTVPDQTLSMRQILERYYRGEAVSIYEPVYSDDEDVPDVEKMDKLEKLDLLRDVKEGISEIQDRMAAKKAKEARDEVKHWVTGRQEPPATILPE